MAEDYKAQQIYTQMVMRAEDALRSDKDKAQRLFKLWAGILPKKRAKRSNLFIRKIFALVESAVSRHIEAQFQFKPYYDLESRSGNNTARADNAEQVLQYYLEQADIETKMIHVLKQAQIENVGVMKIGWKKLTRTQKQRMSLKDAMQNVKNFKMPPDLEGLHVFVDPSGVVATDNSGGMVLHKGKPDDTATALLQQGYQMVALDKAPPEVQDQFTAVVVAPKTVYDGLEFTPIEFQDSFWDPDASSWEELRFAGHHFGATFTDLEEAQKSGVPYKNLDQLKQWALAAGTVPDIARYRRRGDLGKSEGTRFSETETVFRVTELWHVQKNKLCTFVTTGLSNQFYDAILIREEDCPYWHGEIPYHYFPASIIPFEIIGTGIAELSESLQNEYNDIRNILMDLKVMTISPPIFYNENVVTDPSRLDNLEPGKKIPLDVDPSYPLDNVVKTAVINPGAYQNASLLEASLDRNLEEVTGVSKATQGIPISRRTTYSEQSLLSNEGNFRFRLQIRSNDAVMKRLARQAIHLLDQFVDPQVEIRITGDDGNPAFKVVDREDLSFDFDIYPASSSVESLGAQVAQANQMIQGYQAIHNGPMERYLKPEAFLREYLRKLQVKNVDKLVYTDQEIQQMTQQQAQQQAQAQPQPQPQQQQAPPQQPQQPQQNPELDLIAQENQELMQGQDPPVTQDQDHVLHMQNQMPLIAQLSQEHQANGMTEEQVNGDARLTAVLQHLMQHAQMDPNAAAMLQQANGGAM